MTDLKEKILDDLVLRKEYAKALNCSVRKVVRLDLPTIYIGRDPYVIVSKAKAKLMGEDVKPKRGRPHKAA